MQHELDHYTQTEFKQSAPPSDVHLLERERQYRKAVNGINRYYFLNLLAGAIAFASFILPFSMPLIRHIQILEPFIFTFACVIAGLMVGRVKPVADLEINEWAFKNCTVPIEICTKSLCRKLGHYFDGCNTVFSF